MIAGYSFDPNRGGRKFENALVTAVEDKGPELDRGAAVERSVGLADRVVPVAVELPAVLQRRMSVGEAETSGQNEASDSDGMQQPMGFPR